MIQFVVSQVFGGIALILVCISYFLNKNKFLFLQIFANVFYGAAFLVSLSLVAGINTFISIFRCILILYYEKQNKTFPIYYLIIFCLIYICIGIVFYKNAWDIITMLSPILFTLAMIMKKMIVVKWFMLFPNLALMLYCVLNRFYTSAVLDLIEFIVILVAIIVYYIEEYKNKDKSYKIIKKIVFDKWLVLILISNKLVIFFVLW